LILRLNLHFLDNDWRRKDFAAGPRLQLRFADRDLDANPYNRRKAGLCLMNPSTYALQGLSQVACNVAKIHKRTRLLSAHLHKINLEPLAAYHPH
jgi:hypothetical protein